MNEHVCAVLPALDEADALPAALVGRPYGLRVIVVDNGSTDATAEVARRLGAQVVTEPRRGFGAACLAGAAAAPDGAVLVFMDADGSLRWADAERVAAPVVDGRADLSLGWRRRDLRSPHAMPWHVAAANGLLGGLCGLLARRRLHDIGPLRAIPRETLFELDLQDRTYGWPLEMVLRAGRAGLAVVEVPVGYRPRVGTSKVTGRPWPTVKAATRMLAVLAAHAWSGWRRG